MQVPNVNGRKELHISLNPGFEHFSAVSATAEKPLVAVLFHKPPDEFSYLARSTGVEVATQFYKSVPFAFIQSQNELAVLLIGQFAILFCRQEYLPRVPHPACIYKV